jgi:hypothetical protein
MNNEYNSDGYFVLTKDGWRYTEGEFYALGESKDEAKTNWRNQNKRKKIQQTYKVSFK